MLRQKIAGTIALIVVGFFFYSCGNPAPNVVNSGKSDTSKNVASPEKSKQVILFFGNSLTAGYGIEPSESYPSLIQQKIDSAHLSFTIINAGVSGETSAGGNGRIDWILKNPLDVFVLELGANDGLRGIPVNETQKNLQSIINKVKKKYPKALLVLSGMQIPPSMGQEYALNFKNLFPALAAKNKMALVPFLLQGVAGDRQLNQADGIHPTAEGAKIVAQNVWKVLQPLLQQ